MEDRRIGTPTAFARNSQFGFIYPKGIRHPAEDGTVKNRADLRNLLAFKGNDPLEEKRFMESFDEDDPPTSDV